MPSCSVACFKQHKADGCFSSAAYQPPPRPVVPVSSALSPFTSPFSTRTDEATSAAATEPRKDDDRPRKRLKDLHWPAEPDPTLWETLQRDEVKPLRHSELEAVGASFPLLLRPLSSQR